MDKLMKQVSMLFMACVIGVGTAAIANHWFPLAPDFIKTIPAIFIGAISVLLIAFWMDKEEKV